MNTRPFINLVLVWICFSLRLEAQGLPVPSTEVTLKVWTKNDQTTFQVGEIIPLQLAFTSSVPQKYQLNMAA